MQAHSLTNMNTLHTEQAAAIQVDQANKQNDLETSMSLTHHVAIKPTRKIYVILNETFCSSLKHLKNE